MTSSCSLSSPRSADRRRPALNSMLLFTPSEDLAQFQRHPAAMDALLAFEDGQIVGAERDGLSGAHGDTCLFVAGGAQAKIAKDYVIGKAGHGLHLAAHQQSILLRDE